jgi:hypothetical protein
MSRLFPCLVVALCLSPALHAAQPQFFRLEGARDFLEGDSDGVSVDSEGRLRLAPASAILYDTEVPFVWSLARDRKGTLYAGTGNDGKVFRIDAAGKASLFFDAPELEVHALAVGSDGRLFVGTSPDGKVYVVGDDGIGRPFYDPEDKYIWAMAFDRSGRLLIATGAEGRLHRVDAQGTGEVMFTAADTHLVSLAVAGDDVYAGSSPGGVVYHFDAAGKASVLHDSEFREVKALAPAADGSLYAIVVDAKDRDEPRAATPPIAPAPVAQGSAEVTITESFSLLPPTQANPAQRPEVARGGSTKGAVLRILSSGEVDTLWSSRDDAPHALLRIPGGVLVATGNKGKIFEVHDDRTWSMVGAYPCEQVTALQAVDDRGAVFGTSNPGKVFSLGARPGARGTFTSKVKDTDTVSTWGRIAWEGEVPSATRIEIQTRTGNTSAPDTTWSEWSTAYTHKDGEPVSSERARFLQVRVTLTGEAGATPVLDAVSAAYLQRNLRPQVQNIVVYAPGEIFQKPVSVTGEVEVLGLEPGEGPETRPISPARPTALSPTAYSRKLYQRGLQTLQWKADDPNGDTLVYDVQYRAVGDSRLRMLRKGTSDTVLAWDTSTVPNGRYVIRVTARDTPGNPEALALAGDKESAPFSVDNTPPVVTTSLTSGAPTRVRAVARDDFSLIRKAEYTVDGGRWQEVHPTDGINDALEEHYEIVPGSLPAPGPHVLVVRATDLLGNIATARIEIP